jgi:drug/metabolite transporter (DMT)-like permease
VPRHAAGSLAIAGCALSWGFISIIVRELDVPALAIVFYRVALAAVAIGAVLLLLGDRDALRLPRRAVLALGVLLAVHWSLFFTAIKETSVASAVLITYAAPVFMAMLAPVLIRERVPAVSVAALGVSVAGISLITLSAGDGDQAVEALGVALAVLAAITYALLIVLLKRYAADVNPVTVVLYESLAAAAVLSPAAVLGDYALDGREIGYLLLLGVVLTGAAGIVYVGALRSVAATTAGILAYMEPVSAALLAALLLGQELTAQVVGGGLLIVGAGVAVVLRTPEPLGGTVEEPVVAAAGMVGARRRIHS